jgi:hypothetical protein
MSRVWILLSLTLTCAIPSTGQSKPESPRLEFVKEFVRQTSECERLRSEANEEVHQAAGTGQQNSQSILLAEIHGSTAIALELRADLRMIQGKHFNPPFQDLVPALSELYREKLEYHQRLVEISKAFIAESDNVSDYNKMTAELPEIRANLENIDNTLATKVSVLVFMLLTDMRKTNTEGKVDRLIITRADRDDLVRNITESFGDNKLKDMNALAIVAVSGIFRDSLKKKKCSDDPDQESVKSDAHKH